MSQKKTAYLGVGFEWADGFEKDFLQFLEAESVVELTAENFVEGRGEPLLSRLEEKQIPVLLHGVGLSLGTAEPFKQSHFDLWRPLLKRLNVQHVSDHLAMTEAGGIEIGQLIPLQWNRENLKIVADKILHLKSLLDCPFLIENINNPFIYPQNEMTETDFISHLLEMTDCGLLLDLNSVFTNGVNFKIDPVEWIDNLPLERVDTIHLAGGEYDHDGQLLHSHNHAVRKPVWDLYEYVCRRIRPRVTIIERRGKYPGRQALQLEKSKALKMLSGSMFTPYECQMSDLFEAPTQGGYHESY